MSAALAFADALPGISPDVYGPKDFQAVSEIVHAEAGIVLPQGKAMLVYSRLAPLVRETNSATFSAFIARIREDAAMRLRAVQALTTNHTFFYRESHHFDHLAATTRPSLIRKSEAGQPVRIWSAGCSSGEETWSIVTTLLGEDRVAGLNLAKRNVVVLASDLAAHALKKAQAATYPKNDIEAIPATLRRHWVNERGAQAVIADEARALVRFRLLNLLGDWPMKGQFDVIFCRNVMIYFDGPTKDRLVARFAAALVPGGHLYIGHSERVSGPAESILEPCGPTIYRKVGA